jgi:hypothetical protein
MLRPYLTRLIKKENLPMNFSNLVRDASRVKEALKETKDNRLICSKEVKIYVPSRFIDRNLAIIGMETYILGIYAIVVDNQYYGVSLINAMMQIEPTITNRIKIDGTEYLEFVFVAGSTVVKNINLVKIDAITYRIYDEILSSGHVPWYMGYEDLCNIFNTANSHAGANIGQNREVTQMLVSIVARLQSDRRLSLRHAMNTPEDKITQKPAFVALNSINYTATNTTAKISGAYQGEGIISAMVNPSERVERIEAILLK